MCTGMRRRRAVRTRNIFYEILRSRRQCRGAEGPRRSAVDHEPDVDAIVRQLQEVDLIEFLHKFAHEVRCILRTKPKRDQRPDVPQDSVPYVRLKLVQILVPYREADPVLAQL